MKFLHDKKKPSSKIKDEYDNDLSEYNKDRKRKKIKSVKDMEAKGLVVKSTFELVFGRKN